MHESITPDDVRPLAEHGANAAADVERVRRSGRPLFLTTGGQTSAVLLSPEAYDQLVEQAQFYEDVLAIKAGVAQADRGEIRDVADAMRDIAAKHDLPWEQ